MNNDVQKKDQLAHKDSTLGVFTAKGRSSTQKTSMEVWLGKPPTNYDKLRVLGCLAYYHVIESKLDPRVKKAFFLGFISGVKDYKLWNPNSKKISLCKDFNESSMLKQEGKGKENMISNNTQKGEFEIPLIPTREVQTIPST